MSDYAPQALPTQAPRGMRKFTIARNFDESGVSGTGVVIEGVEFACGRIALKWLTPLPDGHVVIWESWDKFLAIHVHPHPSNITRVTFEDDSVRWYPHPPGGLETTDDPTEEVDES